jgi:hypothetical protein
MTDEISSLTVASDSTWQQYPTQQGAASKGSHDEIYLRILIVALFLPDGLSIFIGDFRLSSVRVMLIVLSVAASIRYFQNPGSFVVVPSDLFALATGVWMILAPAVTGGLMEGLKGGTANALEFTGGYFVFRRLLGPADSSVRLIRFTCKVMIAVVALGLLDVYTGTLFTYELVKQITGRGIPLLDKALAEGGDAVFRNGMIRATGPLQHSILFGTVCAWFSTIAIGTFRKGLFAKLIAGILFFGIIICGSRAPLPAYAAGILLLVIDLAASWFRARWRVLGSFVALYLFVVFTFSGNPISTLLRYTGIDPEAAYYREVIWQTVGPMVMGSPAFGLGLYAQPSMFNTDLVGTSVDSLWLETSMLIGIPGALLMFLTMVGAFWKGPVDKCPYLSKQEQQLSMALGFVIAAIVYIGFTVHLFGACAILIGIFPGMRANLAEAALLRANSALTTRRPVLNTLPQRALV